MLLRARTRPKCILCGIKRACVWNAGNHCEALSRGWLGGRAETAEMFNPGPGCSCRLGLNDTFSNHRKRGLDYAFVDHPLLPVKLRFGDLRSFTSLTRRQGIDKVVPSSWLEE